MLFSIHSATTEAIKNSIATYDFYCENQRVIKYGKTTQATFLYEEPYLDGLGRLYNYVVDGEMYTYRLYLDEGDSLDKVLTLQYDVLNPRNSMSEEEIQVFKEENVYRDIILEWVKKYCLVLLVFSLSSCAWYLIDKEKQRLYLIEKNEDSGE